MLARMPSCLLRRAGASLLTLFETVAPFCGVCKECMILTIHLLSDESAGIAYAAQFSGVRIAVKQ